MGIFNSYVKLPEGTCLFRLCCEHIPIIFEIRFGEGGLQDLMIKNLFLKNLRVASLTIPICVHM
jgi:hypothetical protein